MLGTVFTTTLKDMLRPGRVIAWVIIAAFVGVMGRIWVQFGGDTPVAETYGLMANVIVYRFMALVAAIFSTFVVSQEIGNKTIVYQLTRVVPRGMLLLGRTLACVASVILISWIAAVASGIGVFGLGFLQSSAWYADLGILALGSCAYTVLFVFISLIVQKAMVFSLLFAFGWETFVPNMPGGDLSLISIISYLNALSRHPKAELLPTNEIMEAITEEVVKQPIPVAVALSVLGVFSVALMVVSMNWFNRFEYVPREDGD